MDKEEYYKRIEKINNRFKTDRVSAYEEYQLVCQRNYLSAKYIEHLEQQCKKQQEINKRAIEYIKRKDICIDIRKTDGSLECVSTNELLEILEDKEV